MPVIDAHHHFWSPDAPWHVWPQADLAQIARDFGPGDLLPLLDRHGIDGSVLVQSQPSDADTDWMLDLAARTPRVLAVVGWINLVAAYAPARVAALAGRPTLKGLRPMLQDLPAEWVLQPAAEPALVAMAAHGLVLDALIRPVHLPAIAAIAARHPTLSIVVDHAAKPDIAGGMRRPWADDLARLADFPSVACKLSGMVTEAAPGWTDEDLAFYVRHVLDRFGADRVLWGSDWPVVLLAGSYDTWLASARQLVPASAHTAVFGGTATRLYRLLPGEY